MVSPLLSFLPASQCIDLLGKTDLLMAYACLRRCNAYVGNDSGLMHLAAVSGIPTLGLFGPSPEKIYAPWGENCSWVRTPKSFHEIISAPDYSYLSQESYMSDLRVQTVEAAFVQLLERCLNASDP